MYLVKYYSMTHNHNHKNQVEEEQIIKILKKYQKTKVTVQQYCQLSCLGINLDPDILYESYLEYTSSSDRNDKENYKMLAGFLCSPNVKYLLDEKDQTKEEAIIDAGKKIINKISYAWEYYFNLIKKDKQINAKQEKRQEIHHAESLKNSLIMAKKHLLDMLGEIKRNRFHLFNYTKQNLAARQAQSKQINQEQTFMTLLLNIFASQFQKMKEINNNTLQQQKQGIVRIQQEKYEDSNLEIGKDEQNNKDITKIINIQDFLQRKLLLLQSKVSYSNPINKYEEQRKFNINTFKYCLQVDSK